MSAAPGTASPSPATAARARPLWRAVAIPAEHGGWGLTLEPILLGLLVEPSWSGVGIGLAAVLAFLARTPAKLVLVDRRRHRHLARTRAALVTVSIELAFIVALALAVTVAVGWAWWVPVVVAAPLVLVELWFDARSRSRRLVPELLGAVGIAASAAAITLAGDGPPTLAIALWIVLAARSLGAIPFVRAQIRRARRGITTTKGSDAAQLASVAVAFVAVWVEPDVLLGVVAVTAVAVAQLRWSRRDPPAVKVLGLRQMAIGLAVVFATAVGIWAS